MEKGEVVAHGPMGKLGSKTENREKASASQVSSLAIPTIGLEPSPHCCGAQDPRRQVTVFPTANRNTSAWVQ